MNTAGQRELLRATAAGDVKLLKKLLKGTVLAKGGDINLVDKDNLTLLHIATKKGHGAAASYILSVPGCDPNIKDKQGNSPIFTAALLGHLELLVEIYHHGGDILTRNLDGASPLYIAAYNGHLPVVEWLVRQGCNVNQALPDGGTPLHSASFSGRADVVRFLVSRGAKIDSRLKSGATPLCIAVQNGHQPVVQVLCEFGAEVNCRLLRGITPLFLAAQYSHVDIARELVQAGADVHAKIDDGATPLYIAAQEGSQDLVALLLFHGADPNVVVKGGWTALHIAAKRSHLTCCIKLIRNGASPVAKLQNGKKPIDVATDDGMLDYLNTVTHDTTAMVTASIQGETDIVEVPIKDDMTASDLCARVLDLLGVELEPTSKPPRVVDAHDRKILTSTSQLDKWHGKHLLVVLPEEEQPASNAFKSFPPQGQSAANPGVYGSVPPQFGGMSQFGSMPPQYGAMPPQYGAMQPQYGAMQPQYGSTGGMSPGPPGLAGTMGAPAAFGQAQFASMHDPQFDPQFGSIPPHAQPPLTSASGTVVSRQVSDGGGMNPSLEGGRDASGHMAGPPQQVQAVSEQHVNVDDVGDPNIACPTFFPPGGNGRIGMRVFVQTSEVGATVRTTTDGTDPHRRSALYAAPLVLKVPGEVVVKAITVGPSGVCSIPAAARFFVQDQAPAAMAKKATSWLPDFVCCAPRS